MRKLVCLSFGLLLAGLACLAQAQVPMTGAGKGAPGGAPPAYQGPGDVVSGAFAWWGLRCYNTAYAGNVADVYAPADASHTLLTCSAGGTINETIQPIATTCAVSCTIKTLYDQSGANSCTVAGGSVCDLVQATEANRPTYTVNCIGSKPCGTGSATVTMATVSLFPGTLAQPNWFSGVVERTGSFTAAQSWIGSGGAQTCRFALANQVLGYAGSVVTATGVADGAFHAIQCILNSTSSELYVDGASTTGDVGTAAATTLFYAFTDSFGETLIAGNISEIGIWSISPNGTQNSAMNSNQHSYWGF